MGKAVAAGRALGFAQGSGVDPLLREMIFACQSFDLNKRPTLNELLHGTMDAIQTRTAEWYRVNQGSLVKSQVDPGREEDGAILQLMHDLIINAPAGA